MTDSIVPRHIGYIVDGNRRWAKQHGLPAYEGHLAGLNALKEVAFATLEAGVECMSAYMFSTENWKRSKKEVSYLMGLIISLLSDDIPIMIEKNIKLKIIGSRDMLGEKVLAAIADAEERTKHLTGGTLLLCINYGGQLEIADAVKKIIDLKIRSDQVTPELISQHLYAPGIPPIDIIIRTSGEQRISNFMLWWAAYSELMFLDKPWPDMTKKDVTDILIEYNNRNRRFGG